MQCAHGLVSLLATFEKHLRIRSSPSYVIVFFFNTQGS